MKQFILSSLLLCGIAAHAQFKVPIYLRADMGLSNVKVNGSRQSTNFAFGIGAESIIKVIALQKDADIAFNPNISLLRTAYNPKGGGTVVVKYFSVGLPVSLVFMDDPKEDAGFLFGVGPFINVAYSGKYRPYTIDPYTSMKFGNSTSDNRTTTDVGFLVKAAIRYKRAYVGMQNNLGTKNLIPKDRITSGSSIKSRNFLFYITYKLGKYK